MTRCFSRRPLVARSGDAGAPPVEWIHGNLHSREDCARATRDVQLIVHLAAGTGTKSYADAFLNSVVTTRNLLEAAVSSGTLKRFGQCTSQKFVVLGKQKGFSAREVSEFILRSRAYLTLLLHDGEIKFKRCSLAKLAITQNMATRLVDDSASAHEWTRWVQLLVAFAIVYTTVGWMFCDYIVES